MSVRAKFCCHSTTAYAPSNGSVQIGIVLFPVYGNDNASWSEATPHGKVELTITAPEAAAAFGAGQHYWLDFTPVAAAAEQDAASADANPAKQNTVSTDVGNLLLTGQDGLPYLSANAVIAAVEGARWGGGADGAGNIILTSVDGNALGVMKAPETPSPAAASRAYPNEIQVGDVIDPVPEAGHDGPQYVTAVTQHPDGTALELRPATAGEIAAAPSTGTYTSSPETAPAQAA